METCVSALPSGKLSGLLEVVRLTCEEGFELGQLMTDTRLHDARRKRDSEKGKLQSSRKPERFESFQPDQSAEFELPIACLSEERVQQELIHQQQQLQLCNYYNSMVQQQHEQQHEQQQQREEQQQHEQQKQQQQHEQQQQQYEQHEQQQHEQQKQQQRQQYEQQQQQQQHEQQKQQQHEQQQQHIQRLRKKEELRRREEQEQQNYIESQAYPDQLPPLRQHVSQLLPSSGPSVPRPPPDKAPAYKPPTAAGGKLLLGGPCESCGATESPQWRRPDPTRVLLCNRCGIHYGRYKKLPGKRHQHEGSVLASAKTGTPGVSMKRKSHDSRSESDVEQPSRQVPRPYSGPSPGLSHALPQASPGSANNAPRSDERPIPVRPAKPGFPLSGMERQATWSYGRLIDHPGGKNNGSSHGGEENSVSQEVYLKSLNWQQQQLLAGLASSDPATSEDDGSQDNAHQKKYALQKKLRVFSNQRSEAFAPPQSSRDSTHDYGASFSGHSTYQPGHAPPGHSAHPHPLFQPQVSHAANSDEFGIGAGGNRRSASQPAQQHYILQNEVLMSFDGSPVDSATYNNVLGSLLQQQRQLL